MRRGCRELPALDAWARDGMREPLSEELQRHADGCSQCAQLLSDLERTRELFVEEPEPTLEARRVAAVRFAVLAGARKGNARRTEGSPRRSTWWRRLALAAAVLTLVGGLAVAAGLSWPTSDLPLQASVRLSPGAAGEPLQSGPDAVFVLRNGTAEFSVPPLGPGQKYRVLAAGDEVEVRGTEFEVAADERGLQLVRVRTGEVIVRVRGEVVAELEAGGVWRRSDDTRTAALASVSTRPATAESRPLQPDAIGEPGDADASPARVGTRPQLPRPELPSEATPRPNARLHRDAAFRRAWKLLQSGRHREAARSFDALSQAPGIDPGRRADLLYWSAKAHQLSGEWNAARSRAEKLVNENPRAWHAARAALLVGESHLLQGNAAQARASLEQALSSDRPEVRRRAQDLLKRLDVAEE